MELKRDLKEQYHGGLAMLAQCVAGRPDEVGAAGAGPRAFWRIAFHTVFYTHLYLGQNEQAYKPWDGHQERSDELWTNLVEVEPYELPPATLPVERDEMLRYLGFVDGLVNSTVDVLDLDSND